MPEIFTGQRILNVLLTTLFSSMATAQILAAQPPPTTAPIEVAVYYYPNYHPGDARNSAMPGKGPAWSEWELVKAARPRYPGHHQPRVPLWGYTNEADPAAMAQKIDAAADHSIDAFIFDWYYYNDGPFLNKALDEGYLHAPNRSRVKFALMWANHDWYEIQPASRNTTHPLLFPGAVTPDNFTKITNHVIKDYFSQPTYWRVQGRPYFSIYDLEKLVNGFGSVSACRAALDDFRSRAVAAGLPGIHLNAVIQGRPILPGDSKGTDIDKVIRQLGFDSVTSYVWIHHAALNQPQTDYLDVRKQYFHFWDTVPQKYDIPYIPNVSVGWDSSPRTQQDEEWGNVGYPFTNNIENNTPELFKQSLAMTKEKVQQTTGSLPIININSWNEWTEGSYLEPDTRNGMQYLDAIKAVFPKTQ
jgi:hypothetical protein